MALRKLFALVLLFSLSLAGVRISAGENMIKNGGFEEEFNTVKDIAGSWTIWGHDPKPWDNYTRDTENPHGGEACMKVYRPASTRGPWFSLLASTPNLNILTPKPGKKYTVTFWARTDTPGDFHLMVGSYKNIDPYQDGSSAASLYYKADKEWKQFSVSFQEGKDIFAGISNYMYLAFFMATNRKDSNIAKTLWVDDVSMIEEEGDINGVKLINPATLEKQQLDPSLTPGDSIDVVVDAAQVRGQASLKAGGVSMMSLNRWCGTPYSKTGEYNFDPRLEKNFREVRLPMTRYYALVEQEPFTRAEDSLDKVAEFMDKIGVPKDTVILCLEPWHARTELTPETWVRAVKHCLDKNYGFRYWEIGNEVYLPGTKYRHPDEYLKHFIAVSKAIRKAQPDALIGLSTNGHGIRWCNYMLKQAAGHYDYVCPHFYGGFGKIKTAKFEDVLIGNNHVKLAEAVELNALLKAYNPDREVYIYDSEWGLHSSTEDGKHADWERRNGNILGVVYRAVRLVYYARENVVYGASSWKSLTRKKAPGFGILYHDAPEMTSMLYWLYYYFNRTVGEKVLAMEGTVPYYDVNKSSYPLTPLMVTASADGKKLYLMLVNASWDKAVPASIDIKDFAAKSHEAVLLSHDDRDAWPYVKDKSEFVHELEVLVKPGNVSLTLPAHSVAFITLER